MQESERRYSAVSIALHWAIAALVLTNVWAGGQMEEAADADRLGWLELHKSVGITVLSLTILRLAWRLTHKWPPLPDHMPRWQRILARTTHVGFYVLLLAIPLFGWAAVSAYGGPPVPIYGGIPLPDLPTPQGEAVAGTLGEIHKALVKATYVLIVLHVAGALKHHFLNKDNVLHRMLPVVPAPKR